MKKVMVIIMLMGGCSINNQEGAKQMNSVETINNIRSGVVQIILEKNGRLIPYGSGFIVKGGVVTNSHNIRTQDFDAILIRFEDSKIDAIGQHIRLSKQECEKAVESESPQNKRDYIYLRLPNVDFGDRHVFEFDDSHDLCVGEQVAFLGFPFGMSHLTSHMGYVSGIYEEDGIEKIQIDGSINGGNSGGPLINLKSGKVVGIVTSACVGFIVKQFKELIYALRENQKVLETAQASGSVKLLGVDPLDSIKKSQAAMEQIALNLRQSANVGIGYAHSSNYVRDDISQKLK